jgi:hypothetical protein
MTKAGVLSLHPTQLAVGFQQVDEKARKLKKMKRKELDTYLKEHEVPGVKGPGEKLYMIDHHHLCTALFHLKEKETYVKIVDDWSNLPARDFWARMNDHQYLWPFDQCGNPVTMDELPFIIPCTVEGLKDDPYRSLAGVIRKLMVYEKVWIPFTEFKWANFLRTRVHHDDVNGAIKIAKSADAKDLPGFIGSSS